MPIPTPERHLRSLSVAAPGSMRQLLDLAALLESIPFDPDCSPWDVTLIEGLEDGRAALYLRAHHVLTDGVGGIRLLGLAPRRADVAASRPSRPRPSQLGPAAEPGRERRPQAGHVHDHGRSPRHGAAAHRRRQRGPRRESDRHGGAWCPAGPRCRQLGLPSADGDRWAVVVAARVALAVQSLRGDLGRRRARRRARPRWQPERPPRGRRRCRPRALPR